MLKLPKQVFFFFLNVVLKLMFHFFEIAVCITCSKKTIFNIGFNTIFFFFLLLLLLCSRFLNHVECLLMIVNQS
jgi:phosphotransferase system  glucose/maltose/N-acetylglucosamine-specific IIC component